MRLKRADVDCLVLEACLDAQPSANGWRRANCPLCVYYGEPSEDTKQSFGVHESGAWHCFRCGAVGYSGEASESGLPIESTPDFMEPPEGFISLSSDDGQRSIALAPARDYLTSRGVTADMIERTGLGACASGYYAGRIVAPVFEPSGQYWLGYMTRVWLGDAGVKAAKAQAAKDGERFLKYRYPNWPGRGRVLYNQAALLEKTDRPVLTGEGVFDVIHHLPHAVACLGKPSHDQLTLLLQGHRPVCFVLDGDAWKQARALCLWMRLHGKPAGFVRLPPKTDPDAVPPEVLAESAKRSISDAIEV